MKLPVGAYPGTIWPVAPGEDLSECPDEFVCDVHARCAECGRVSHHGEVDRTEGYGPAPDAVELVAMLGGDPYRCFDCRHGVDHDGLQTVLHRL